MRNVWPVLLWATNLTIIGLLTGWVMDAGNCKAPLVLLFGYLALVVANLVLWGLLALFGSRFTRPAGNCVLFLALLFLPLLIYALNV